MKKLLLLDQHCQPSPTAALLPLLVSISIIVTVKENPSCDLQSLWMRECHEHIGRGHSAVGYSAMLPLLWSLCIISPRPLAATFLKLPSSSCSASSDSLPSTAISSRC